MMNVECFEAKPITYEIVELSPNIMLRENTNKRAVGNNAVRTKIDISRLHIFSKRYAHWEKKQIGHARR